MLATRPTNMILSVMNPPSWSQPGKFGAILRPVADASGRSRDRTSFDIEGEDPEGRPGGRIAARGRPRPVPRAPVVVRVSEYLAVWGGFGHLGGAGEAEQF